MGKLHLMNALHIDGINIVAVADKSERNRKSVERYHLKTYEDYNDLLDAEKLDAVIISLPNFLKKESVFRAAERKLDIFLDKPLSRDLVEAQEIVRKVEKENVRLMVGVNYRYYDCVQKLKNAVDDGKVGDIVIATSDLILNGPFSHPLVPTPVPDWWLHKETAGGGALIDLGYHLIDLFSWMFGRLDVNYSNLGHRLNLPLEDAGTVILESENSTTCIANFGWFQKSIFPDFNFRFTVHGVAGYDSTDRYTPRNLRTYAIKEGTLNLLRKLSLRKIHYLSYTYYYESFFRILKLFFEMLRQGTENPVSLGQQLEVLRIIDSVCERHGVN
jgi:predicted dehydrogenase